MAKATSNFLLSFNKINVLWPIINLITSGLSTGIL